MNHPTQPPAAEPSDAAVAQAFRDVMNGPFDIDAIYFVNAVNARARELDALRNPEADAGGGWLCKDDAEQAVWQAIRDIRFGNKDDDKLIVSNLRAAGLWIARYAPAPPPQPTAPPAVEGEHGELEMNKIEVNNRIPTHYCNQCGALWIDYYTHWSLASLHCGKCCDNVPMGEQIVPLPQTATPPGDAVSGQHVLVLREMRARFTDAGSPARTAAIDAAIEALAKREGV